MTFTASAPDTIPTFTNLLVTVNTLHVSDSSRLHRNKQLEKFVIGKIHCCNIINQDLTFLQPSTIHETKTREDSIQPEPNPVEVSLHLTLSIHSISNTMPHISQFSTETLFHEKHNIFFLFLFL